MGSSNGFQGDSLKTFIEKIQESKEVQKIAVKPAKFYVLQVRQKDKQSTSDCLPTIENGSKALPEVNKMIKRTYKILLGLSFLFIGGLTMTANAQIPDHAIIKANIPFSFIVRDKTFSPGKYTIKKATESEDFALEITDDTGHAKAMVFETNGTTAKETPKNSNIVFDKLGDKYFLSKIFVAGDTDGNEVEKSKLQKDLEKNNMKPEKYVLKTEQSKAMKKVKKEKKDKN